MLTHEEILQSVLLPAVASAILAAVAAWRRWPWAMPLIVAIGFLTAYAVRGVPQLPPVDGSDWLFWTAIPLALLAAGETFIGWRLWTPVLAVAAGIVAFAIIKPLTPAAVSSMTLITSIAIFAVAAVVLTAIVHVAQLKLPPTSVALALCITLGGAGVTVFASGFRVMGAHGLAAAAAMGPVAIASWRAGAPRPLTLLTTGLLAGILSAGHFYAEPGLPWSKAAVLYAAPALLIAGAYAPTNHRWLRATVALLAVAIAVGAVTAPSALAAKRAAETHDPYADYYK
jgi:hypothetical protein